MFCRHCGKELDSDSVFCRYCGKPTASPEEASAAAFSGSLTGIFGGIVFLILSVLVTVYCLLHLTGSGAALTMLMTIPAVIICIGCWCAFAGSRRKRHKGAGLTLIGGGLIAQIVFVGAEGAIFGVLSVVNFINFLNAGFLGNILQNYGSRILVLLVLVGVVFVAYGAVMEWLLSRFRRYAVSAKRVVLDKDTSRWRPVRVPGAIIFSAVVAAGAAVKLLYIHYIYELFYFMLYPRMAMADGIFSYLFSDETSGFFQRPDGFLCKSQRTGGRGDLEAEGFLPLLPDTQRERQGGSDSVLCHTCLCHRAAGADKKETANL